LTLFFLCAAYVPFFFFLLCFALPHSTGTNLCEVIQRVGIYVWKDAQNSMVPQTKNFEMVRVKRLLAFVLTRRSFQRSTLLFCFQEILLMMMVKMMMPKNFPESCCCS